MKILRLLAKSSLVVIISPLLVLIVMLALLIFVSGHVNRLASALQGVLKPLASKILRLTDKKSRRRAKTYYYHVTASPVDMKAAHNSVKNIIGEK